MYPAALTTVQYNCVLVGSVSVIMDVFAVGVLVEDTLKLLAELAVACSLLTRARANE